MSETATAGGIEIRYNPDNTATVSVRTFNRGASVSRLTGLCRRFRFVREYQRRQDCPIPFEAPLRTWIIPLEQGAIYEFRDMARLYEDELSGFWVVDAGGTLCVISEVEAVSRLKNSVTILHAARERANKTP